MFIGDVEVEKLQPEAQTIIRYLLKYIKKQDEEMEELRRHLRGQSRAVGKMSKKLKEQKVQGGFEQMEIEMGGNVI